MANGRTHDRFNIVLGVLLSSFFYFMEVHLYLLLSFVIGWCISTFIFSPDTDLMPKKRTGLLRLILYPYSIFFKHRGLSHSFLFGTLTRIFYLIFVLGFISYILNRMNIIDLSEKDYLKEIYGFLKNYDYESISYRLITWLLIGLFLGDLGHLLLDLLSSFINKYIIFWK